MTDPSPRRTWRQRLRFRLSVRALMVLVLVLGGWLGWIVHEARVQREVVAAIEQAGGKVSYDWDRHYRWRSRPNWAPRWLVDSIGTDFLSSVGWVEFRRRSAGADVIAGQVARLGRLDGVNFRGSDLSDVGLARLAGADFRMLLLEGTNVTDTGLPALRGLSNLESLDLFGTKIGDSGMAHITNLPKLRSLNLGQTNVTDTGMEQIEKLCQLEALFLFDTQVGDRTLVRVKSLINLKTVQLRQTQVSQKAIDELASGLRVDIIASPPRSSTMDEGMPKKP